MHAQYQLELSVQHRALRTFWGKWHGEYSDLISPLLGQHDNDLVIQWGMQSVTLTSPDWIHQVDVQGWWDVFVEELPAYDAQFMGWDELQKEKLSQVMRQSFGRITILIVDL